MSVGSSSSGAVPAPAKMVGKPKVAFESLTAREAVWHMVVLIAFAATYLIVVVMVRFSLTARLLIVLVVVGAAGLVAVLTAVATTHRSSVLRSLRSAIASRDADRIQEAILRAQAAGVSKKDVANMQELREAVSSKLAAWAQQEVGMTAEEVAFAEKVLARPEQDAKEAQDSPRLRVVVQRPSSPPAVDVDALHQTRFGATSDTPLLRPPQADDAGRDGPLRELHLAVEAGDAGRLREAISLARDAGVSAEEVTLAEAVFQIEEARLQRVALHALRQARLPLLSEAPLATAENVSKLRAAVRNARGAGVSTDELQAAEAVLLSAESRLSQPRRAQAALKHGSVASPKKRVSFADECSRIYREDA